MSKHGLSLTKQTYVKCYLGDTGLLVSHAFDENELLEDEVYKQIFGDKLNMNEGMLYENAIAQMLTANGHKLYFYTHYNNEKHRNDIEIDFLISNNSKLKYKIYPIEVKSGKKYSIESLKRFKEKYSNRIGECYVFIREISALKRICLYPALYDDLSLTKIALIKLWRCERRLHQLMGSLPHLISGNISIYTAYCTN